MADDSAMFLCYSGQKPGRVHERYEWNIEAVTHTNETGHLIACVDIDHACYDRRFLANNAYTVAADACQAYDRVACPTRLDFKEGALIDDLFDHLMHDIRLRRIERH